VPVDPVGVLIGRHEAAGLDIQARTGMPGWTGEHLDVGWAIDVLHPLANSGCDGGSAPDTSPGVLPDEPPGDERPEQLAPASAL
jgi:hypothetical protein